MRDEAAVDLIIGLTRRLSAVADEFADRAQRAAMAEPPITVLRADPAATARRLLAERLGRGRFLPASLFDEPAWVMLLTLFIARDEDQAMNMKQLVAVAAVPVTTAQRWVDQLHRAGLIRRAVDQDDRRRVELTLSDAADESMRRYLDEVGQ